MTQSREPNDRDLVTRIAQLEYRLTRLENTQAQLENTMTPGGYITAAFERVHEDIDAVNRRLDEQNRKIDIILRHVTGMGNDNS
jgi:uncharacterized coiled-coil protein SlyX